MRFNLHLTGHTVNGTECLADISVYANDNDLGEKAAEAATYAIWFEKKPGFPMVADGIAVILDDYREHQKLNRGMPVEFMPMSSAPGPIQDMLASLFADKGPKK